MSDSKRCPKCLSDDPNVRNATYAPDWKQDKAESGISFGPYSPVVPQPCKHECRKENPHNMCQCAKCGAEYPNQKYRHDAAPRAASPVAASPQPDCVYCGPKRPCKDHESVAASSPVDEERDEFGWLIEKGQLCLGSSRGKPAWVTFTDPSAVRFARKLDAENMLNSLRGMSDAGAFQNCTINDHAWLARATQEAAPRTDKESMEKEFSAYCDKFHPSTTAKVAWWYDKAVALAAPRTPLCRCPEGICLMHPNSPGFEKQCSFKSGAAPREAATAEWIDEVAKKIHADYEYWRGAVVDWDKRIAGFIRAALAAAPVSQPTEEA